MDNFLFLQSYEPPVTKDIFFVWVPSVNTKDDLFKNLSTALNFPGYFGYNWDALLDLFLDFTWIIADGLKCIYEDTGGKF
ncbi:barstar family protein [uncultured Parabacteroides sp.]|jgi:RNAse (barnase) inhibitor barstar|uniref:barstar family protein n=1 Tax=uncultured Parabacteroides sp. TaxID=512312 RepID=UPI0025E88864|nr:barstar family protein [uncultured Parabacteroides sp.]